MYNVTVNLRSAMNMNVPPPTCNQRFWLPSCTICHWDLIHLIHYPTLYFQLPFTLVQRLSNTVFPLSSSQNSSIPLCLSTLLSTVPFAFYSLSLAPSYENTHVLHIILTFPANPPLCHSSSSLACSLLLMANTSIVVVPSHITQLASP
jgi:hypothetical protein